MGPRPNGRGKLAAKILSVGWTHGVNGAAAKRPRKAPSPRRRASRPTCVNGAAAKRPRKAVAFRANRLARGKASMGPRPNGRGKTQNSLGLLVVILRQWGRGQTAAERGSTVAFFRAANERQWGRGQTAAERRWRAASPLTRFASMGPRPNGRGKLERTPMPRQPQLASMGPRPNGRGKRNRKAMNHGLTSRQWGRGQTAAERPNDADPC